MHRYKARLFAASLGFSQLSLAFRYQAWLFISSKHASAEKQIDGQKTNQLPDTAREAKLTFRFHKTK